MLDGLHRPFLQRTDVARQITEQRAALKWTRTRLAREAGVSVGTIKAAEEAAAMPKPNTLARIWSALDRGMVSPTMNGDHNSETMSDNRTVTYLALYDYRQAVSNLYRQRNAALEAGGQADFVCDRFRQDKNELLGGHPQSALSSDQRRQFEGLCYFPYNLGAVVDATISPSEEAELLPAPTSGSESMPLIRVATLQFELFDCAATLSLFWIDVYGGGLFLPF